MNQNITCLGIESSCDDTAASVVSVSPSQAEILSSVVFGQTNLHQHFGGVVPEIAARAHAERIDVAVKDALHQANLGLKDCDLIAVTAGPGLIGGVMSGVMFAKGLSASQNIPLIGVNHLAGHALTPRLTDNIAFPYLMLLVSGGHCQFLIVHGPDSFERLGGTIDDAPGEAFDKTARILGLPQPGGPAVESFAKTGDPNRFKLPRPLMDQPGFDLSFSGLKTALMRAKSEITKPDNTIQSSDISDLCASFQLAVSDVLTEKSRRALNHYKTFSSDVPTFAVAGGVAANQALRSSLEKLCEQSEVRFCAPPLNLCTDNAAMIAFAGAIQFRMGNKSGLDFVARPRWPLDTSQPSMLGSGKKGPKA